MYLWKCWREYRGFALLFFVVLAGVLLWTDSLALRYMLHLHDAGMSRWPSVEYDEEFFKLRQMNVMLVTLGGWIASIVAGAGGGIGREFDGRLSDLLFSRPARRRRLLWINWLCAVVTVETVQVAVVLLSCGYCFLRMQGGAIFLDWMMPKLLRAILLMLPLNMLILGISLLGGVFFRGASKGTLTAGGAVLAYLGVSVAAARVAVFSPPGWWFDRLMAAMNPTEPSDPYSVFPVALFFGWSAAALLFPFAAQLILERRDVA